MKIIFSFSEDDFIASCVKNLNRAKTTVFQDLYDSIKYFISADYCNLENLISIISIKHSYKTEYYDTHLALLDYELAGFISLPYPSIDLCFQKDSINYISEVTVPEFFKLDTIDYGHGVYKSLKIKEAKLKTKDRIYIQFLNLKIFANILKKIKNMVLESNKVLLPSKLGTYEWRQTFYSKINGEVYFCECFKDALIKNSGKENNYNNHNHLKTALVSEKYKKGICHICNKSNSDLLFCAPMYGSAFKVKYGAYIKSMPLKMTFPTEMPKIWCGK